MPELDNGEDAGHRCDGIRGVHLARALVARGDDLRVTVRASSSRAALEGLDVEFAVAQLGDRAALRRAMRGVDRVFHVAGLTSPARLARRAARASTSRAPRVVLEEALRADVERVVYTSSVGAVGPARPGGAVDETRPVPARPTASPMRSPSTRPSSRPCGWPRTDSPVVVVNPTHVLGPRRRLPLLDRLVRRFLPAADPGLRRRGDQRRRRRGRGRRPPAGRRARDAGRALHPGQPQLHARPAVRRPGAPVRGRGRRRSSCRVARRAGAGPGRGGRSRPPAIPAEVRAAAMWWTYASTKAKRELGFRPSPARGDARDDDRLVSRARGGSPGRSRPAPALALRLAGFAVGQAESAVSGCAGGHDP